MPSHPQSWPKTKPTSQEEEVAEAGEEDEEEAERLPEEETKKTKTQNSIIIRKNLETEPNTTILITFFVNLSHYCLSFIPQPKLY